MNEADSDNRQADGITRGRIAITVNEIGCEELQRYERMLAEDSMDTEEDTKAGLNNNIQGA